MNFPSPLSCKDLTCPRKQTWDHLHFWQAQRKDKIMLDKALIRGFYEPELVHARQCFHSLESLKTPKKTPGGSFFIQFSLLRPKKYKTNHRRNLLASEEVRRTFFILSREGSKKVKLPPTQRYFKSNKQLDFYECEGRQDHSERSI